jgi:hypothetical protein
MGGIKDSGQNVSWYFLIEKFGPNISTRKDRFIHRIFFILNKGILRSAQYVLINLSNNQRDLYC